MRNRDLLIAGGVLFGVLSLIAIPFAGFPSMTVPQGMVFAGWGLACILLFAAIPQSVGLPRLGFPPPDRLLTVLGTGKCLDENGKEHVLVILSAREGEIVLYDLEKDRVPDLLKKGDLVSLRNGYLRKYREDPSPSQT